MRSAIVTGAGTGIGAATAVRLAACGCSVLLVGRREAPLRATADAIRADGGSAVELPIDLARTDAPEQVVAAALEGFGGIDVLVNNAAVIKVASLDELTVEDFDAHVAVNVRAPFALVRAALAHLRTSPAASVVNISSSSGTLVREGQSVYGMTKAALEYLTRSFAAELAGSRIRVNALAPGPVDTPIHATWAEDLDATHQWLAAQVPLGRIGTAQEIARWVELLVSEDSAWMTGAVIPVDGGQVLDRV